MKNEKVPRRDIVGLTSAAAAGSWFAIANYPGARFVRQAMQETTRRIAPANWRPTPINWDANRITASWLGHATVLLNFYGVTILTDPVFFARIGAHLGLATVGPKRLVAPPLLVKDLPRVDVVLLSHAHMDHLDLPTLRSLPAGSQVLTADSTLELLRTTRLRNSVKEMRWGESTLLKTAGGELKISAFEVKHWGARWRHDKHRGYNGYILERGDKRILFGGDTAMTDKFKLVRGHRPFDLAIMPIGSYKPFKKNHCTPEESVAMTNAAGADRILPIHFKTFRLGEEGTVEPLERLIDAIGEDRVALREVGETFRLT